VKIADENKKDAGEEDAKENDDQQQQQQQQQQPCSWVIMNSEEVHICERE
jgi:hypothetical protein